MVFVLISEIRRFHCHGYVASEGNGVTKSFIINTISAVLVALVGKIFTVVVVFIGYFLIKCFYVVSTISFRSLFIMTLKS